MTGKMLIVVTGANRGIGYAICEKILSQPSTGDLVLYATSRNGVNLALRTESSQQVVYRSLDIDSNESIKGLVTELKNAGTPLDVLINNAGVNIDDNFSYANASKTMNTNYRGTLAICEALLPLMQHPGSRIVNLSSTGSNLRSFSKPLQQRFRSITNLRDLESLMRMYEEAVKEGKDVEAGFPAQRSYSVSKAAINVLTKVLAQENQGIMINCCCPGWVSTDMGNQVGRAPKTPEEGARIPVKLAFGDISNISGSYWSNDSVTSTEDGKVQDW